MTIKWRVPVGSSCVLTVMGGMIRLVQSVEIYDDDVVGDPTIVIEELSERINFDRAKDAPGDAASRLAAMWVEQVERKALDVKHDLRAATFVPNVDAAIATLEAAQDGV